MVPISIQRKAEGEAAMDVTVFLSRLGKVRKSGKRWMACCPAHADKSPSLMISERPDGSIGINCFAGCATEDVVAAIGLTLADLFLDSPHEPGYVSPRRQGITAADALRMLALESGIVAMFSADLAEGREMTDSDFSRFALAHSKLQNALEFVTNG